MVDMEGVGRGRGCQDWKGGLMKACLLGRGFPKVR